MPTPKKTTRSSTRRAASANTAPAATPAALEPVLDENRDPRWARTGNRLTTVGGTLVDDTDNSLKVGPRGSTLLEDHHLREKITHFDHERIPERVVHARGAGAHGTFQAFESAADLTVAQFLAEPGIVTPVFVRFSTVAGSRGSADTARDVRGFATRFYTPEGNFDLVGNNIPIFFIQDGIKFPDLIHAAKPEPDREIPQAQTAHDTFWDFAGLTPESTAMLMWIMSDRAIPRSYRMMEGFGVHTFRLQNAHGDTSLVKFHWKPSEGLHSLVWEEAQKLGGIDPDFHRRDLWDAIEAGAFPSWDLGVQVFPDDEEQAFEGIDLLDPTKIVPEELAPVRLLGRMTLDRNPTNYFAETEQVAFHLGQLVPGIGVTDDPLLQARLFSYLDTQLTRLGGPNFAQIPINRSHASVNDNLRDGFMQQAIPSGRAPYSPNSVDGGCPMASPDGAYVAIPTDVAGTKVRQRASSFDDHFSQATHFWSSMTDVERDHIVSAFSFELGKVDSSDVVSVVLGNLAQVDGQLVERIAEHLGVDTPAGSPATDLDPSPALSMIPAAPGPIRTRVVGILAASGSDRAGIAKVVAALARADAVPQVIAPTAAPIGKVAVDQTFLTADTVNFDALVVAGGSLDALGGDPTVATFLGEAYRHHKTLGAWGDGADILAAAGISPDPDTGVVVAEKPDAAFSKALANAVGWHRHWNR